MDARALLTSLRLKPRRLHRSVSARTRREFRKQFLAAFESQEARSAVQVVYIWASQRQIPRLKGKSNIAYIGQTKQSLRSRYVRESKTESKPSNWQRYGRLISKYGTIDFWYARCRNPRSTEDRLFKLYYKHHLESPPINER